MPSVETLSRIPLSFEAGTTVVFQASNTDFPSDEWTLGVAFNNGTSAIVIPGVANGSDDGFTVTLSSTASNMPPGRYTATEIFTNIADGAVATGRKDGVDVLPNPAVSPAPSFAQAQVALLKDALASLATSTRTSVNFNGQSYTRADASNIQRQLVYWESRVIAEARQRATARGETVGGFISVGFERADVSCNFCR